MDVTVTVYPLEGEASRIAKELLSAASHVYEVRVVSHPKFGFVVPEDVFERFQQATGTADTAEDADEDDGSAATTPKRRGRPRKNPLPEQELEEQ